LTECDCKKVKEYFGAFLWFAFAQGTNLAQGQEELDSLSLEVSGPLGVEPFVLFYSDSKGEAVNRFLKGNEEDFSFSEFEIVESSSLKERSAKTLIDLVKGDDNDVSDFINRKLFEVSRTGFSLTWTMKSGNRNIPR